MGYTNSVYPAWNGRLAWIEGLRGQTRIVRERAAAHPAPRLTAKPKRSTYGAIVILHSAICASFCLGSPARASLPTGLLVRPQGHRLARWRMLQIECPGHFCRPSPVQAGCLLLSCVPRMPHAFGAWRASWRRTRSGPPYQEPAQPARPPSYQAWETTKRQGSWNKKNKSSRAQDPDPKQPGDAMEWTTTVETPPHRSAGPHTRRPYSSC